MTPSAQVKAIGERLDAIAEEMRQAEASFPTVEARFLRSGTVIVEINGVGKQHRETVKRCDRGCDRYSTHVTTVSGKSWCYDARFPVMVDAG